MEEERKTLVRRTGIVVAVLAGLLVAAVVVSFVVLGGRVDAAPAGVSDMASAEGWVVQDSPQSGVPDEAQVASEGVQPGSSVAVEPGPVDSDAPPVDPESLPCDFPGLLGQVPGEALLAQTLGGRGYRVLPPGSMATQDYSPARVNLELDESGKVKRVWCG